MWSTLPIATWSWIRRCILPATWRDVSNPGIAFSRRSSGKARSSMSENDRAGYRRRDPAATGTRLGVLPLPDDASVVPVLGEFVWPRSQTCGRE